MGQSTFWQRLPYLQVATKSLLTIMALTFLGCNGADSSTTSHGGPAKDHVSLVDNLRANGLTVIPSGTIFQPFFPIPGQILRVNDRDIQVYEFDSPSLAQTQLKKISSDGKSINDTLVSWVGPPHFFQNGKILVLYIGSEQSVQDTLSSMLGPQTAGEK